LAFGSSWHSAAVGIQQQLAFSSRWHSAEVGRQQSVGYELYNVVREHPILFELQRKI
jgi:hypothetical protein